jgi:hypothetical protein
MPAIGLRSFSYIPVLVLLSSCGPLTKIGAMSEPELRSELTQCAAIPNPSNSKAIACQNFNRECEKRVNRDGKFRDC